jgi:hypothetical protein
MALFFKFRIKHAQRGGPTGFLVAAFLEMRGRSEMPASSLRAVAVIASAASAFASGSHSCAVGDYCNDVSAWCPARNCGAFILDTSGSEHSPEHSAEAKACEHIRDAKARHVQSGSSTLYCVSEDTTVIGFQCFGGDDWLTQVLGFLQVRPEDFDGAEAETTLTRQSCESLELDSPHGGTLFLSGRCCTGGAVPCHSVACSGGFVARGPGFTSSVVSIMLAICAIVHLMSALMCLAFADRILHGIESVATMKPEDLRSFKYIIMMLGAAHGGFASILVFGALQDWMYGKSQIALAALVWYGLLGPVAEAMQHSTGSNGSRQYLSACVSTSQGECGGGVPRINYVVLCLGLVLAIGVRARRPRHLASCARIAGLPRRGAPPAALTPALPWRCARADAPSSRRARRSRPDWVCGC